MLAGKPFLWDIYRESNNAHFEKIQDFTDYVDETIPWGETLKDFVIENSPQKSLEKLLFADKINFRALAKKLEMHDITDTIAATLDDISFT